MSISYDVFTEAFLWKVTEYNFLRCDQDDRVRLIDGYLKKSVAEFKKICKYDLSSTADDEAREFAVNIPDEDLDEIGDIISEGMLVQWMKPYFYKQENLQNTLNTRDFTTYSPAELLHRIQDAYNTAKRDFVNMMREYSYNHADLTELHL